MRENWLADAVLYEIYPQSFADSNGDGVGDLRGVIERLDHIASLGVDAIWFNPCFASPFVDAGYDVSDYLRIAPRYGTNDDMIELVAAARARGIRVLLDLVAGHTSIEHPWFQRELTADGPDPEGDRYYWRTDPPAEGWAVDIPGTPAWVPSPGPRPGWYLKNFYDEQPALNFGWVSDLTEPGALRNRRALRDIIDFWLSKGVSGFRVDMAFSLVKDYHLTEGVAASTEIWREIRDWMAEAYPDAVLIPEGTEPRTGRKLAFDADFALVIKEAHASLFDNHAAGILPFQAPRDPFFDAEGKGSTQTFLAAWNEMRAVDPERPIIMSTADHDFDRLCCGPRTAEQLGAALTFLFTWGNVPCLYYGDEIGMRYLPGMPNVEGAVCNPLYNRAGCRTPMQWDDTPNAGFSTADPSRLYLPVDPDPNRPTVAQQNDTLALVRQLIALRKQTPALRSRVTAEILNDTYPLAYVRGGTHLVVVNPRRDPAAFTLPPAELLLGRGVGADRVDGFGYGIFRLI
ncbi:alpha-amylase family glycosyl hydrolase [Actinoplanes sp. NPDC049596]|uniref:alpha-amylase family glycosyl hydrolase n=1 Tax=unclassified Actinoplanes TaxID=2626549 RepID=UPI00342EAFB1